MSEENKTEIKYIIKKYKIEKFECFLYCKICNLMVDFERYDPGNYPIYNCSNCGEKFKMTEKYPKIEARLIEVRYE